MKRTVIIDTDPGIDDALALLLALNYKGWNIKGITTVAGNVPVDKTALNAIKICSLVGEKIAVYAGAEKPLYKKLDIATYVHGENGIGGVELTPGYEVEKEKAVDFLLNSSRELKGKLELVTLAPLTNIASAIMLDETFSSRIKSILIMGGAVSGGNVTASAEYNIYADPEAARIVFQSGIPITMVGLDVTNRALLPEKKLYEWQASTNKIIKTAGDLLAGYMAFYDGIDAPGIALHDPFAMAAAIDPSIIQTEDYYIDIETRSPLSAGRTVADILHTTDKTPNVKAAMELNLDKFLDLFISSIESY